MQATTGIKTICQSAQVLLGFTRQRLANELQRMRNVLSVRQNSIGDQACTVMHTLSGFFFSEMDDSKLKINLELLELHPVLSMKKTEFGPLSLAKIDQLNF